LFSKCFCFLASLHGYAQKFSPLAQSFDAEAQRSQRGSAALRSLRQNPIALIRLQAVCEFNLPALAAPQGGTELQTKVTRAFGGGIRLRAVSGGASWGRVAQRQFWQRNY
jgi:hypothetical protein